MPELSPAHAWLLACILLLTIEAFGLSGIGFAFAGIAALVVGLLVYFEVIAAQDWPSQLGAFGGITALVALLLWRKLKQWRSNRHTNQQYSNMIGDFATVGKGGLEQGAIGQVSWSGTTMMAQIDASCAMPMLAEGALVTITAVKGNQLFVAPQKKSA